MAKLLLLDDDEGTLVWMAAALGSLGHEVRSFQSGNDALAALRDWVPDLIIADLLIPEMDGLTFARLARRLRGVPLMFVSIANQRAEAVLAGAVGYVRKPATAGEIRDAVERALGRAGTHAAILVVDDDPDVRDVYRGLLSRDFDVLEAENGSRALDTLRARHVDLVILDVHMPVMNGVELLRVIRADKALDQLPVIVQTTDRAALSAPVWRDLNVSQLVDKIDFLGWFEERIDAHLACTRHER
jgi:CheY-like chemotaxis protein